jgi:hypothetical protein
LALLVLVLAPPPFVPVAPFEVSVELLDVSLELVELPAPFP